MINEDMPTVPERAVRALQKLIDEASAARNDLKEPALTTWKMKAGGVLASAFGEESPYVNRFWKVRFSPSVWTEHTDVNPYRISGVAKCAGILEAAIHQLQLFTEERPSVSASAGDSYDAGLWQYVRNSVDQEEWSTVAMSVAQYVEHHIREWSEIDLDGKGQPIVGKTLALQAFAADGPLRLGRVAAEVEGWRNFATGFMQALSNVDRHRIQKREDLKRYALGVLGTGSLILTQIRYQHPDLDS